MGVNWVSPEIRCECEQTRRKCNEEIYMRPVKTGACSGTWRNIFSLKESIIEKTVNWHKETSLLVDAVVAGK